MGASETGPKKAAAFFDVDGTLLRTTIVDYYKYFRQRRMSAIYRPAWTTAYLLRCIHYLLLDKIDRSRLNIVFYRSYAGMSAADTKSLANDCHRDVISPRTFPQGQRCINEHRAADRMVVLATGSIDFIMEPLARHLAIADVIAPGLVEVDGRFTGELSGPPIGDEEKARRIRLFAERHNIDLTASFAYGDSIADLPMLRCVGNPHAVNPDRALARMAQREGWPIHRWSVGDSKESNGKAFA